MSYRMRSGRSIPTLALTLLLILPTAAAVGASGGEPPERGRVAVVLEALWHWLGLAPQTPAAAPVPGSAADTATAGSGTPDGNVAQAGNGEGNGNHDPNGGNAPPPGYEPDLTP